MSLLLILALQLAPLHAPAHRGPPDAEKLSARVDALAREAIDKEGVPGLSIAVGQDGEILLAKGYGYADAQRGVPATADTLYDIGSLTRQFIAVGILQLAEEKKLSLDDELKKWLPEFPTQGHKLTLRQLLSNTSGVPGYAALAAKHAAEMDRGLTREQLFALFKDVPFDFAPGTGFSFNNSGYLLLSMVIAKASGEEYGDYMRAHVLEPAELGSTRFCPPSARPVGFAQDCKALSDEKELLIPLTTNAVASTQGLCSTVKDLFRWQCALSDRKLIDEKSTREMLTPTDLGDGLSTGSGFAVAMNETEYSRVYSHTGGVGGFRVRLAYYSSPRLTVVVLGNCASAPVERLERAIADAALDLLPAEIVDLALTPKEIALYTGSWQVATSRIRTFEKDGKLWFERPTEPAFALMHQGQHVFVASTDKAMRITFKVEEGKPADSFEILRNGLMSTGKRME